MHTHDELRQRAVECETMATIAGEPEIKAAWLRMAKRWHRWAEADMRDNAKPVAPWMHH
jgi:hypothetical protein